jgi:hypothetical protein
MDPSMQTCLNTLRLGDEFLIHKIATLDADAARRRVAGEVNPIVWLAGHLLMSRNYLLGLFGEEKEFAFASQLEKPYDPSARYPSLSELKDAWVSVSDDLFARMEKADGDHFTAAIDWNLPNGDRTVRGAVLFYTYHEAWHLGQIAYALRGMGMEGLVGR